MSQLFVPLDAKKSEINSALNATVLHIFLMGMYIVIYIVTMYTYFPRKWFTQRLVLATITIQCLTSVAYTGFQWYGLKWQFIDNGDTRDSIFQSLYATPEWLVLASDIARYIILILADGLLIWRCFFIWGRSFRVILVPSILLIMEIGLFLAQPALRAVYNNTVVSPTTAATFNALVATAYFITFATSLIATALVAYRVHAGSNQTGFSRRLYINILDIVVQSGAVYSLTALATAISVALPGGSDMRRMRTACAQNYVQDLSVYVSGLSATIMVARVGLLSADSEYPPAAPFSELQFRTPTVNQT